MAVGALMLGGGVLAAGAARAEPAAGPPTSGFYIGGGGSVNLTRFDTQNTYFAGTSDIFEGGVRTNSGAAGGPARNPIGNEVGAAPTGQLGYFQRFTDSRWLWGAKASYSYLGATASGHDALLPQFGSFSTVGSTQTTPFTGNGVIRSYEMRAQHQIAFTPFLGHASQHGFFYLGGGPTLTRLQTNVNGLVGFADLSGVRTDISGPPQNFSSAGWVWGGMFIAGVTWFVTPDWFLDLTYTASATLRQSASYSSGFLNTSNPIGVSQGALFLHTSGGIVSQGATLTLNRRF